MRWLLILILFFAAQLKLSSIEATKLRWILSNNILALLIEQLKGDVKVT